MYLFANGKMGWAGGKRLQRKHPAGVLERKKTGWVLAGNAKMSKHMLMFYWKQSGYNYWSVIQKSRLVHVHHPLASCVNNVGQSSHLSLDYFWAIFNNNQLDQSSKLSQPTIFMLKGIFALLEVAKSDQ